MRAATSSRSLYLFAAVLRRKQAIGQLASVFWGTLPLGVFPVAIVLAVHAWTGSFVTAGLVGGSFTAGNAVGLAVQGALIDRFGARMTILAAGAASVAAVSAFVVCGVLGVPVAALMATAAGLGLTLPEITTAVRAWVSTSGLDRTERISAYSLLAMCFQVGIVIGPLLVVIAFRPDAPEWALVTGGVLSVAAAGFYLWLIREGRPVLRTSSSAGVRLRWVVNARFRWVLVVAVLSGVPAGLLMVVLPKAAAESGFIGGAGFPLAALAAGEVVGALAFGSTSWRASTGRLLTAALALGAAAYVMAASLSMNFALLTVCVFVVGLSAGPVAVVLSTATDSASTPSTIGRASGLRISATLIASAVGSAAAGGLGVVLAVSGVLLVGGLVMAVAAGVVALAPARFS